MSNIKTDWNFMNAKHLILLIAFGAFSLSVTAQETSTEKPVFKPSGKASGKVFWNYNHNFTDGVDRTNSFELQRTYLGYSYNFSEAISAKIVLDGARSISGSEYNTFVKNAQLDWKVNPKALVSLGMIGLKQYDTQESFMGFRYVYKDFQDDLSFGTTADLGVNLEYAFNPKVTANLFVINGEGFTKKQDEFGKMKVGANVIVQPIDGLTLKAYGSVYEGQELYGTQLVDSTSDVIQNYDFFAGYKTKKYRIGLEYSMMLDGENYWTYNKGYNSSGFVLFAAYVLNEKWELFGHLFSYSSNKVDGASISWNYDREGESGLIGVQYAPVKGVKSSLNYRNYFYANDDKADARLAYLNFEFTF
jgi:hypothetical protein